MTTIPPSTVFPDLISAINITEGATISKTLYQDDKLKVVLFGFGKGQELSEHTAGVPAILQFLDGKASVTLGQERLECEKNSFIHMPKGTPHSITAQEETRMLLILLKKQRD